MNKVVADNHRRVVEVIRSTAAQLGTPEDVVARVIDLLRPSIRLVPRQGPVPRVGASKAGGAPDLPEGMGWPLLVPDEDDSPVMWFVLQVDLAEVAAWDVEGLLPRAGLLSVFLNWDEDYFDPEPYFQVRVFPPSGPPLRRAGLPEALPPAGRFREVALEATPEWTIPSPEEAGEVPFYESAHLHFWGELDDRVTEAQGIPDHNATTHRLLGHPQLIQSPGIGDGSRLLLQVCSDNPRLGSPAPKAGMMWGDAGRLYVLLAEADLRAGRWDKVWCFAETC